MYLNIGASVVIPQDDILGIFDLDNTTWSKHTRNFLAQAEKLGQVTSAGDDLPKSFLLCQGKEGKVTVYLSQLSPATLIRRLEGGETAF